MNTFETWKTIKLGTHKSGEHLIENIKRSHYEIGDEEDTSTTKNLVKRIPVSKTEVEVSLVKLSPRSLGLPDEIEYRYILEKAISLGLKCCPPEVGPQLLLQTSTKDFDSYDFIYIGMRPVSIKKTKRIFLLVPKGPCQSRKSLSLASGHFNDDEDDGALTMSQYVFMK